MPPVVQSTSRLAPIGVNAALEAAKNPSIQPKPKIFDEFALTDRVGIVSGGNRGLGLEMALAMCEAGARTIYCFDLPTTPSEEWTKAAAFVNKLGNNSRLEYTSVDVRDQEKLWAEAKKIGDKEQRMDICVAAAGIINEAGDCLEYPAKRFENVLDVNVNGVLFTAQAAGQQMRRFGNGGSIILIASIAGSVSLQGHSVISYQTSKSAVLQMARSMACELGKEKIRVNSVSPGYIYTAMTGALLEEQPEVLDVWSNQNPLGRIGRSDELRGVAVWLASDASTFCTGSDIIVSGGHTAW